MTVCSRPALEFSDLYESINQSVCQNELMVIGYIIIILAQVFAHVPVCLNRREGLNFLLVLWKIVKYQAPGAPVARMGQY